MCRFSCVFNALGKMVKYNNQSFTLISGPSITATMCDGTTEDFENVLMKNWLRNNRAAFTRSRQPQSTHSFVRL